MAKRFPPLEDLIGTWESRCSDTAEYWFRPMLVHWIGHPKFRYAVRIRMSCKPPEAGAEARKSPEEKAKSRIARMLEKDNTCIHACTRSKKSREVLLYYTSAADWRDRWSVRVMELLRPHAGRVEFTADPEWKHYQDIFRDLEREPKPRKKPPRQRRDPFARPSYIGGTRDPYRELSEGHPFSPMRRYDPPDFLSRPREAWGGAYGGVICVPRSARVIALHPLARAAFAVRCAHRIVPLHAHAWPGSHPAIKERIDLVVSTAERIAGGETPPNPPLNLRDAFAPRARASWESDDLALDETGRCHRIMASNIAQVAFLALLIADPRVASGAAEWPGYSRKFGAFTAQRIATLVTTLTCVGQGAWSRWDPSGIRLGELIKADFIRAEEASQTAAAAKSAPRFPQHLFGPLWAKGEPSFAPKRIKSDIEEYREEYFGVAGMPPD